jgi:hypothetical protein
MVKVVERKKKEKRGQPPLSDLVDPPLDDKQQRKQMRRASVPAPHRRSRRLNPNPDSNKIRHGKPEKRVRIHPKKEEKQVSNSDFYNYICNRHAMTAEEYFLLPLSTRSFFFRKCLHENERERARQGAARKEEHERESGLKKLVQIK